MTIRSVGGGGGAVGQGETSGSDMRMLQARLDLMVSSMSSAAWINPTLALLWMLPFIGLFPMLGSLTASRFTILMAIQIATSFGALLIFRDYWRKPAEPVSWLYRLSVYQALTGIGWGVFAWLLWSDGNPLNNALVTMTVCGIVWAYAFTRAMHAGVYLAGVIPTVALTIARIALSGGAIALPLSLIAATTFVLVYIFTFGLRRQVEVMLRTRFANDDLAEELRDTRDDALRKRFEAEAANASKTTFLANMSHELRTPLNAILGFSELIASETLGPVGTDRYRDYANDINASGAHLLSLINDILDIAKIESGKMEIAPHEVDPQRCIEAALKVVRARAAEKKQTVDVDVAPDAIYSDERAFKQIAINLISNAVKFTPEGGRIAVSLRKTPGDGCELCVSDNGPGIPADLLEQIFLPFNQVDNRYSRQAGGTGLGLSLVRGLAELHGGRAWIESDAGKGVRAFVYLPGAPLEAQRLRRA